MTKIIFLKPHIHGGISYKPGDTTEVNDLAAAAIYAAGSAKPDVKSVPAKPIETKQ